MRCPYYGGTWREILKTVVVASKEVRITTSCIKN
jgi:hypothetical protein